MQILEFVLVFGTKMLMMFFQVDIVLGEPNFSFSLLPWHNLFYWYTLNSLWKEDKLRPKWLLPQRATLWALPVHYKDLWKIRAPVEYTEGFNLQPFDDLIMVSLGTVLIFFSLGALRGHPLSTTASGAGDLISF